jgi:hypothetical protein
MAYLIDVTIAGGAYLGPTNDTQISINADRIMKVENVQSGEIGTSKITMDDKSVHYVRETQTQLANLTNK